MGYNQSMKKTLLKVNGMTCAHCVRSVTSALKGVPGVLSASVDLAAGTAEVDGSASPQALIDSVTAEGYSASEAK